MDQGTVTRGDAVLKINNGPQAAVAIAGIVAVAGILVALVLAGWSSEAIVGFTVAIAGVAAGQVVQTRKVSQVEAKTDQQSDKLDTIVAQTNGMSEIEKQEIADRAAVKMIALYRAGKL